MGKILGDTLVGAVIGAIAAVCLFVIGGAIEVANFGCAILTCDCDKPTVFDWSGMWGLLIICIIGGAVIGLFYGIYKVKQENDAEVARRNAENSEEARKQRVKWANEIKQKALNLERNCTKNRTSVKAVISTNYKASNQMSDIINELSKVAELQGKIDSISEELSKKGGDSL